MAMEYYSFEKVLKELQMEEDELKRLVSEGEIRAFRDEDKMKFKKSDIDGLKKGRMTEPTIILPSGDADESAEDSEVLLVEDDTSETLLDIDDLEGGEASSSTSVPTVDFSSAALEDSSAETLTEELVFEEDSGGFMVDSGDGMMTEDIGGREEETFVEEDTGATAPLDVLEEVESEGELQVVDRDRDRAPAMPQRPRAMAARVPSVPTRAVSHPFMTACLVITTLILVFTGLVMINMAKDTDTWITGGVTDLMYKIFPANHLYKDGTVPPGETELDTHINWRADKREKSDTTSGTEE